MTKEQIETNLQLDIYCSLKGTEMRIRRLTKEEKKKKAEGEVRKLLVRLFRSSPRAADIYPYIDRFESVKVRQFVARIFIRRASLDDLCCLALRHEKHRAAAWKKMCAALRPDAHSKIILLHVALEEPRLAVQALDKIAELGICLNVEEISQLLGKSHIRQSPSLVATLYPFREKETKRIARIERIFEELGQSEAKIKELS